MSNNRNHVSSDDDEDIVVLQVCANLHCGGIDNLEFDEETNESYCGRCRALYARTETEGFRILLDEDDISLISLIFKHFDKSNKGVWDYNDWATFQSHTDHTSPDPIDSNETLRDFFQDEYDIALSTEGTHGFVVRQSDLEDMYGGYIFNHIDALVEDSEALEEEGIIDTGVLE